MNCDHRTIWLYWDNPPGVTRPGYIDLCWETIEQHKPPGWEVRVVNFKTVRDYIPDLSPNFNSIKVLAHRADVARAALISKYGGMWCDSDTLVVRSLTHMTDYLEDNEEVYYGWKPRQPSIGIFATKPGAPLITAWNQRITKRLRRRLTGKSWGEVGYNLLWPAAKSIKYVQLPSTTSSPVHWTNAAIFASVRATPQDVVFDDTFAISLFNQHLRKYLGSQSAKEILAGDTLLKKLILFSREG